MNETLLSIIDNLIKIRVEVWGDSPAKLPIDREIDRLKAMYNLSNF